MIFRGVTYCRCSDCGVSRIFNRLQDVRAAGWSIGRENGTNRLTYAWCPNCSINHRRGRPRKTSH